ncbi:MAG: DUF1549 domain-containing protein [Gemmatales bacterium]
MRVPVLLLSIVLHQASVAEDKHFVDTIAPLLQAKCIRCHSGSSPKGDLDLSSNQGLRQGGTTGSVLPNKASPGLLWEMIHTRKMPPRDKLTDAEQQAFKKWIDAGAVWSGPQLKLTSNDAPSQRAGADWWSLQPIRRAALPQNMQKTWIRTPVDAFILKRLESQGLSPSPEADRRTYLRRLKFDLLGLPPTPEEMMAFEGDQSPDAYEKLVDRYLASPHYGERWGRHWLDVVRFAESHGYETNELRRNAWPYRDWVIRAFNEDKPFARFVEEQLAGDVVAKNDPLNEVATGFLVAGTHDIVGNQSPEGMAQQRQDDLYDMVSTTGSAFLGLTLNCARCHDHKFDPITQRDYYAMQSFFAGVEHKTRMIGTREQHKRYTALTEVVAAIKREREEAERELARSRPELWEESFPKQQARFIRITIHATTGNDEPCIDELEVFSSGKNVALAANGGKATASSEFPNTDIHKIAHLNDGLVGNSHSWISNEKGQGWAQIEFDREYEIDRVVWSRDRERRYRDREPSKYQWEVSLDGTTWKKIFTSEEHKNRRIAKTINEDIERSRTPVKMKKTPEEKELEELSSSLVIYAGFFTAPAKTYLLKRGDPMQKLEEVQPAALSAIEVAISLPPYGSESDRRLGLARWITNSLNPLPARVMVNRLWHYHFGTGLVNTPSDFGFNGGKPSHPELLDWLAAEFQSNGGRLKPLHRLIVLSATYRQSSSPIETMRQRATMVDADNRLLWHFPRKRLEAEIVRDTILSVSGNLDLTMGGPGYDLWKYSNYVVVFEPHDPLPKDAYRRMVYQFKPRTQQDLTFGAFDCPDGTQTTPRRNTSTTALQALNLLNSSFMLEQSNVFATRLKKEANDANEQVKRGFQLAYNRLPTERELAASVAVVKQHGLPTFCRALLNANELIYVD